MAGFKLPILNSYSPTGKMGKEFPNEVKYLSDLQKWGQALVVELKKGSSQQILTPTFVDNFLRPMIDSTGLYAYASDGFAVIQPNNIRVRAEELQTDSVTTIKIMDLNVTTGKINDLAVTTGKLAALAVTDAKINDVSGSKLTNGSIIAGKYGPASIATDDIALLAITTGLVANLAITDAKINDISGSKIANASITAGKYASGSIDTGDIASGAITAGLIETDAVTTVKIQNNAVSQSVFADGSLTAIPATTKHQLSASSITTAGGNVLVTASITGNLDTANDGQCWIEMDGSLVGQTMLHRVGANGTPSNMFVTFGHTPSSGSHTYRVVSDYFVTVPVGSITVLEIKK